MNQTKYWELPFPEVFFQMPEKHPFLNKVDFSEFAPKTDESSVSIMLGQIEKLHNANKYNQSYAELLD